MSTDASGAANPRAFDPTTETHYAISQEAEFELRNLFRALEAVAQIADTPPDEFGPELEPSHIAPLFATFAVHGQRIMAEMTVRFPKLPATGDEA